MLKIFNCHECLSLFQSSDQSIARPDLLPGQLGERAAPRRPVRRDRPQLQPRSTKTASRTIHSQTTVQVSNKIFISKVSPCEPSDY